MVNLLNPVCAEPRCKQPIIESALADGVPSCDKHKSGMLFLIRKYSALKQLALHYVAVALAYLKAGKPPADKAKLREERESFSQQLQVARESEHAERREEKARLKQELAKQLLATNTSSGAADPGSSSACKLGVPVPIVTCIPHSALKDPHMHWTRLLVTYLCVWDVVLQGRQEEDGEHTYSVHQCILGTHTSGHAQNYLIIEDVAIPTRELADNDDPDAFTIRRPGTFEALQDKVTPRLLIPHDGEVNRARYMPRAEAGHSSYVIATKAVSAEVYVFDTSKHAADDVPSMEPGVEHECRPDLRLAGHTKEGYGLAWSHLREGYLLSGSYDSRVCLWDVNAATHGDGRVVEAMNMHEGHQDDVEDVAWHRFNPHLFGSVGDDKQLILWDTRKPGTALRAVQVHGREVYGLAFNPANPCLLATCSSDTSVGLRDWRNLSEPLHVLQAHTGDVLQVSWSPHHPTVLASSGMDRRLLVWDISRIGAAEALDDADDGPPELLFVHAGQSAKLNDFAWNSSEDWLVAGVSDDNQLQVWQMTDLIASKAGQQAVEQHPT